MKMVCNYYVNSNGIEAHKQSVYKQIWRELYLENKKDLLQCFDEVKEKKQVICRDGDEYEIIEYIKNVIIFFQNEDTMEDYISRWAEHFYHTEFIDVNYDMSRLVKRIVKTIHKDLYENEKNRNFLKILAAMTLKFGDF